MSALLPLFSKYGPYLLIAVALMGFGGVVVHKWDGASYRRLQATFEAYKAQDQALAATALAASQAQKAADDKRLEDAHHAYQAELSSLAVPQPVSHVVCVAPRRSPVSAPGEVPAHQAAGPGVLPEGGPPDSAGLTTSFDPGPPLDRLHDYADKLVAQCRELDASVPH